MFKILFKIKDNYKKIAVFCGLFLAIFFALFYLANFDFSSLIKVPEKSNSNQNQFANLDDEFKKRLGSTIFSMESYADWAKKYGLNENNSGLDSDPDKDNLPNYLEYVHGTNPTKSDTDADGFSDKQEITNGYDPDASGDAKPLVEIAISKINVFVPMVWSKSEKEKDMLSDLERGVAHYFKTASLGQIGNAVISGHSSNYFWAKGDYNYIFKDLNNLEKGDEISVKTLQKNGRVIVYRYKVSDKFITAPDDAEIFAKTENPVLTLSTCWPLGTNLKRLIVKAELVR